MNTRTRSPTPCASRSRPCANASANLGSSRPCPASATASREGSVDRAPGLSVRLKLTLSYAAFIMVAGVLLLAVVWVFLLRYVPDVIFTQGAEVPNRTDLVNAFKPRVIQMLVFLLAFGVVGGWLLAGRMLAPLTRITHATRQAAGGSLSHRIAMEGRNDEFRELADDFDSMLARLE